MSKTINPDLDQAHATQPQCHLLKRKKHPDPWPAVQIWFVLQETVNMISGWQSEVKLSGGSVRLSGQHHLQSMKNETKTLVLKKQD